jgi:hypothetical protein
MTWKEQLKDTTDDLERIVRAPHTNEPVMYTLEEAREALNDFISTEIIAKLIDEIPANMDFPYSSFKQQLRDKWL